MDDNPEKDDDNNFNSDKKVSELVQEKIIHKNYIISKILDKIKHFIINNKL